MTWMMIMCAVLSFAGAIWAAQLIASDIQLIIVIVFSVAGFLFVGLAYVIAALHHLTDRASSPRR